LFEGWKSGNEEAVTQAAQLLAPDMTEGSCVALFRILIAWVLRQRFSQEHYSGCLDRDDVQEQILIDRWGRTPQERDTKKT
jgi:hypothetical protein